MLHLWHLTPDAQRAPGRVPPAVAPEVTMGSWPIEPGQRVGVQYSVEEPSGKVSSSFIEAAWHHNTDVNSYWRARLPAAARGARVSYTPVGSRGSEEVWAPEAVYEVGPAVYVALLWHHHQPLYRDLGAGAARGSYRLPWVRLHALRDYYSMAGLAAEFPDLHLTFNLTPVLLTQLEDYGELWATDRHLDLTLTPARDLSPAERGEILASFFEADWHNQIFPHPRYAELFEATRAGHALRVQDLRDLQMWSNLAWFGDEFRRGPVTLVTGEVVDVSDLVRKGRGYTDAEIQRMVAEQYKVIRAVVPLHRELQDRGQIEVSTTPYYHPILPLLVDTDEASLDRPGTTLPPRFAWPADAETQVDMAVGCYRQCFGVNPRGMWPGEGAIGPAIVPIIARAGVWWIASDAGVLARSGGRGYDVTDPKVSCRAYRAEEGRWTLAILFRDAALSNWIGFEAQQYDDVGAAARRLVDEIKQRVSARVGDDESYILPLVLDGENAWGSHPEDGRPFLRALYDALTTDPAIGTVTVSEWLDGQAGRVSAHPIATLERVHDLHTSSWIDEPESAAGVDLGTWIGEPEENAAWMLLGQVRRELATTHLSPRDMPEIFKGLLAAEGSDWFWWLGSDQQSGQDDVFDELFRSHLRSVYTRLSLHPPQKLLIPMVSRQVRWVLPAPAPMVYIGDRLSVQTCCPGHLVWRVDGGPPLETLLDPVRGALAGLHRFCTILGPFDRAVGLELRFQCGHPRCDHGSHCFDGGWQAVAVRPRRVIGPASLAPGDRPAGGAMPSPAAIHEVALPKP